MKDCASLPLLSTVIAVDILWKLCSQQDMEETGINSSFGQDNQSISAKGVLRGLHFQKQYPQIKLVRAIKGADLFAGSAAYGKWYGVELTEENKKQFLIPRGFAHGFLALSETAKCDDFHLPNDAGGLAWNDSAIGMDWLLSEDIKVLLPGKDKLWGDLDLLLG